MRLKNRFGGFLRVSNGVRRFSGAALVLALGACGTGGAPAAQDAQLYGEVYADVVRYHIEATDPERLTLGLLAGLQRIDPAFSVSVEKGAVTLSDGSEVARELAPPSGDAAAWGNLTARMLAQARQRSPLFADVAPSIADERLIGAALRPLDRFSRYVRPEVARANRAERDGFVGLGVTLDFHDGAVRIASVLPETPAAQAGVEVADRIVAIDGATLASLTEEDVQQLLSGPKDTSVALEVARASGDSRLTFVMRREIIFRQTVTLETHDGIAWLRVAGFNQRTARTAARLLREAHQQLGPSFRGIVLDLRDNPGGLLDQAIDLASIFLDGAPVSTTVGRVPESHQSFDAPREGEPEQAPLAVLIDGGSASSSEIVTAALQDAGRAVVIGSASFGKGTVQTVLRTANGGELTVTWAELFAPAGYPLNHHGVVPTVCTGAPDVAADALRVPRAGLDEDGWTRLRALCPPEHAAGDRERSAALALLGDPARYRAALMAAPARPAEARLPR
jgi:carboxyl-terminal processing protease